MSQMGRQGYPASFFLQRKNIQVRLIEVIHCAKTASACLLCFLSGMQAGGNYVIVGLSMLLSSRLACSMLAACTARREGRVVSTGSEDDQAHAASARFKQSRRACK